MAAISWSDSPEEARQWFRGKKVFKVAGFANAVKRDRIPDFLVLVWDFAEQICQERVDIRVTGGKRLGK